MPKILIISPYFPPIGGSGVFRMHRLAKYLPEFGFQPVIVHFDRLPGRPRDEGLLDELGSEVIICPVKYIEPSLRGIKSRPGKESQQSIMEDQSGAAAPEREALWGIVARIRDRIFVPDLSAAWLLFVVPALRGLVEEHKPAAMITSSSPEVSNIIGLYLKRKYKLPWIADFRDPWTDAIRGKEPLWPLNRLEKMLERKTLLNAELITAYSSGLVQMLGNKIPESSRHKFVALGPAVDTEKFDRIPRSEKKFDFLYTGNYDFVYPKEFFPALDETNRKRKARGMQPLTMGVAGVVGPRTLQFLGPFQARGWLSLLGYVPHQETIALIKSARALVLLHPDYSWWVPGKIAEYLHSGKPILAVGGEGELKEMIKGFDQIVFAANDRNQLETKIEKALELPQCPRPLPQEFSARGQAQIVAGLLQKIIGKKD